MLWNYQSKPHLVMSIEDLIIIFCIRSFPHLK